MPLYKVKASDDERFYVTRDPDEQNEVVRWIVEYCDMCTPEDTEIETLLFGSYNEPSFSDLDFMLRDLITDMYIGTDSDYDEWCEFYDGIEFVPCENELA